MKEHHTHYHYTCACAQMAEVLNLLKEIRMTQEQLAQAMKDLKAQLGKVKDEVIAKVVAVEAAVGKTTPEVDAAFADLKGAVQVLDDLNPDAPPPVS